MIIDCFPFYNELDLLEIRLHELAEVVDVFVLSEATLTFTGKPKPLYFQENQDRFSEFADRICHVVVDDYAGINTASPRFMDRGQKQRGVNVMLEKFKPSVNDMIILADCDEIPKSTTVRQASRWANWSAAALDLRLYYYWMDCRATRPWQAARLLRTTGPIRFHRTRGYSTDLVCWDAGWHFSFLGGVANIQDKLAAYTHAPEFDRPPYNDAAHIQHAIEAGQDVFLRSRYKFRFESDLTYLPRYVTENMDKFAQYIHAKRDDLCQKDLHATSR